MKKIAFLLTLALLPASLSAQNTGTGLPPFGSFTPGGFDTVNNQNLNVLFSIPLVVSTGRGMPLRLSLLYNSNHYQIVGNAWTSTTDSTGNATWGWVKDMPHGGYVTYTLTTSNTKCGITWGPLWHYSNYAYVDALGTSHPVPSISIFKICGTWGTTGYTGYASDNTGYYLDASTLRPLAKVTGPNGQQLIETTSTAADVNGNFITKTVVNSTETDWTDSVGNVALKVFYNLSANPPNIQYQFLDGTATNGVPNYQTITLKLQNLSVKTNFGCGVTEYTGTPIVPQELDIPTPAGGTLKYLFAYEQTPGLTGYYSGRLQRVTLPTGGFYKWDYPGANDSINCSDGTTMTLNRVASDGTNSATWNFVRSGSATTVTMPKLADTPNANDTVFTFNSAGAETQQKIYKESPGVTLLRTLNTTWATNGTPATRTTILEDGTTKAETDTTIDSNGLLDLVTEYDWGSGAHGSASPIRTTTYTYQTSTNYTSRNILNFVITKVIKDGSGNVQFRQDITPDGVPLANCPTGVPQHDDTNYPCSMNYRGNATQITTYLTPSTPSNGISKNFTYDVFGNLLTAQLNCCQNKTWSYSATTKYSQPDSVTRGTSPTQITNTYQYNLYLGLMTKATDPNNLVTNYSYDFLRRPTQVSQVNGSTNGPTFSYAYDDTAFTSTTTASVDSSKSVKQVVAADGLGRPITSTTKDANNNVISVLTTKYDLVGAPYSISNPYTASPSNWTTTQLDVLRRPATLTLPDGSATSYSYTIQTINSYTAETTKVTDPAGKLRQFQNDPAGRLASVTEPDSNNNLNQNTLYTYNVLDELTNVTEGQQTRTYVYDALGRLLSATTPEAGRTCFGSVAGTTCNADGYDNFDNLQKRTDARGVLTTYGYDTLNRVQSISYNVGTTGVPSTASVNLTYGNDSSCNSAHGGGCIGQLISMTDGVGSENYSYNGLEQMTQLQKVINGTIYTTNYQYNVSGQLTQIQYPSGRVIQQSIDTIGRLCEIAPSTTGCGTASTPYATGYAYNVASELTGFKYGNGIYASFGFSSDRFQLTCLDYSTTNRNGTCTHDTTTQFGLTYSYGAAGSNNGQIAGITDNSGTQEAGRSVTYTYDPLYRLSTAVTAGSANYPQWGLSWTYDRYGNPTNENQTAGSPPHYSLTVDPTTNRISGDCFDANGNLLAESASPCPSPTYTYDAENRLVNYMSTNSTYVYDGNGLRVQKCLPNCTSPTSYTVYLFSGSKVIAEYDNGASPSSPSREYIYSGSALIAKIDSTGTKYYHQDHLSNRYVTDSGGNKVAEMGHFPFGEYWYNASNDKLLFTTYERDSESSNDYAMARYYVNRLGRFFSPDPLPGAAGDPQSLNHYPYSGNDPVNLVDPTGQFLAPPCNRAYSGCGDGGGGGGDDSWLFALAFTPTGWDEEGPIFGNIGALNLIQAPDIGPPNFGPNPFQSPLPQPAKPVDHIWDALSRLKDLLANDPDCLAFLGGGGINALERLGTIMDGYYGQAGMLPTKNQDGTWTMTNAVSFGYPGQLVTVNTVGAFYAGQVGNLTLTTDRGRIPGGTPASQGFILLHELGHNTNVLRSDAHLQSLVDANDKDLEQHCNKTIKALSH